jgi:cytochrome c
LDASDISAWDISIQPDGRGLPPGAGTPAQGARIYAEKCARCHGPDGKGGVAGVTASPLLGNAPITDISASMKTIANFLAIRDDAVRLYPAGDAMAAANDTRQ